MHPVQQQQQVAIQPQQVQQQFLAHSLVQLMAQEEHQADLQQEQQDQMMVHEDSLTSQALQQVMEHQLQVEPQPQVEHQLQPVVKVAQRVVYSDSLVQHQQQMEHREHQEHREQVHWVDQEQHRYQQLTSSLKEQVKLARVH